MIFCKDWPTCQGDERLHPRSYTSGDLQKGLLQTLRNREDEDPAISCDIPAALALAAHLLKPVASFSSTPSGYDLPSSGLVWPAFCGPSPVVRYLWSVACGPSPEVYNLWSVT